MHTEFDNSARLRRNVYYFEYKEVRYKLIQNNFRKWCDVLITIVENHNDQNSINNAYILASEFLSSLSWQNNSKISLQYSGGIGAPEKVPLKKAKSKIHNYRPQISFSDYSKGYYDICEIPNIETENQKIALTLFREALHSNNEYLTFLFFWQVLETGGNEPIGWVNKVYRKEKNFNRLLVSKDEVNHLPLNGKSLGNYLYDDCRNAIAHIKRDQGKVELKLDSPEDKRRIAISTNVVKKFARFYIEDKLKLQKGLYLVRKNGKGFPVFVNEDYMKQYPCTIAYKKLSHN
ncbi:hypothetical protein KA005_13865 [bacterium]|nr:hypothetical protein [bacterium]